MEREYGQGEREDVLFRVDLGELGEVEVSIILGELGSIPL
jgi:hypothetical protein